MSVLTFRRKAIAIGYAGIAGDVGVGVGAGVRNTWILFGRQQHTSSNRPTSSNPRTTTTTTTTTSSSSNPIISPSESASQINPKAKTKTPSLAERYAPRLNAISSRTGVPLPSLIISFGILHELTAIIPLILLFYLFSLLGIGQNLLAWLTDISTESEGASGAWKGWKGWIVAWYEEGSARVERVGRRYGILGYEKVNINPAQSNKSHDLEQDEEHGSDVDVKVKTQMQRRTGTKAAESVADAIAAYVVVKALVPFRIGLSIAAAPTLARYTLLPLQRMLLRWRGKSPR